MPSEKYIEQSKNLIKAIDIAIKVVKSHPPKEFNEYDIQLFLDGYNRFKKQIIEAEPKFSNLGSLKYTIQDVFTYFNESSGETVNEFWRRIKESNLPYERDNKLEKILSKQKIKNRQEYDYVIDTMVPFKQEGIISDSDFELLNQLVGEFERRKSK